MPDASAGSEKMLELSSDRVGPAAPPGATRPAMARANERAFRRMMRILILLTLAAAAWTYAACFRLSVVSVPLSGLNPGMREGAAETHASPD